MNNLDMSVSSKQKICRVCLEVNNASFFDVFSKEYVSNKTIANLIMECAPICISRGDGLPDLICDECFDRLQIANQFRSLCVQSDGELRNKNENFVTKNEQSNSDNDCLIFQELFFGNGLFIPNKNKDTRDNRKVEQKESYSSSSTEKNDGLKNKIKPDSEVDDNLNNVESNTWSMSDSDNESKNVQKTHPKPEFKCDVCKKIFRHLKVMENHKRKHVKRQSKKDSSLTCDKCGKVLSNHVGLLAHLKTVHSKERPFECKTCHKRFKDKQTLGKHNFTHNSELSFLCEQCGMAFRFVSNLYKHHYTHSDVRKYMCNICGKSFKTEEGRKEHRIIHTGEKPFECVHCNKRFNFKRNLKEHQLVHTKERPFRCNICNEVYRSRTKLTMHRKAHLL